MSTDSEAGVRAPRLNPFAFPSDTDFRFALLVVSVIGVSLLMYSAVYNRIPSLWERHSAIQAECREAAEAAYPGDSFKDSTARTSAYTECMVPEDRIRAGWMLGGVALMLVVAGLIYWLLPIWRIRRAKLVPLSAEDAPEVVAYLADLCREIGLSRHPIFVWNPLNAASSGLAFGRLRRHYVALSGGLVTQFYTDRPAFRAVMLHELAHLRNGDVDKTYLSVAIWRAFVAVALVPFVVSWPPMLDSVNRTWSDAFGDALNRGWRVLGMTALVYLTRNAVLRAREMYADVRASVWDGPTGSLRRVLEALPHPKGERWRGVLRVHPDPDERRRALDDTDRLFQMGIWDAFGTGIAATIAFRDSEYLLSMLAPMAEATLTAFGSALIFAPLALGVVGSGVWRGTFAALARGKSPRGMGRLGLALGLGAIMGQAMSLVTYVVSRGEATVTGGTRLAFDLLWNGLLLISFFFFFRWVAAGAAAWLEVAAADRSPRPIFRLGLVIAGGLFAVWLAALYQLQNFRVGGESIGPFLEAAQEILQVDLSGPKGIAFYLVSSFMASILNWRSFVTLIIMWAYPLAAWFWRGRVASASRPSWAFLDPSSQPAALPRQAPLRPGLALVVGAVSGVIFGVLSLILVVSFGLAPPSSNLLGGWTFFGQPIVAALMQAGAAAVVAGWVRRLRVLHGLCAAFVAGCVMAGGILALTAFTGVNEWSLLIPLATSAIGGGALLALPATWSVSVMAGWVRRRRLRTPHE